MRRSLRSKMLLAMAVGACAPRLPDALARTVVTAVLRAEGTVAILDVAALLREPHPAG